MIYCGIDVSKHKHAVSMMGNQGQKIKPAFNIANNRAGFDQLHTELRALGDQVTIGLEATGHYWLALFDDLTRNDYPVVVLPPIAKAVCVRSKVI